MNEYPHSVLPMKVTQSAASSTTVGPTNVWRVQSAASRTTVGPTNVWWVHTHQSGTQHSEQTWLYKDRTIAMVAVQVHGKQQSRLDSHQQLLDKYKEAHAYIQALQIWSPCTVNSALL